MWTPATRRQHNRAGLRYETDLTDAEWNLIAPLLPTYRRGRPPKWPMRTIWSAIFYVMRGGIAWRLLPKEFPPNSTVYGWFSVWRDSGLFEKINHALLIADRERAGRAASPTGAVLDSQSVKTTESGGPSGYDAGKKIKGRKRNVLVDTDGRALIMSVLRASVQDRDGAVPLLKTSRRFFPFIARASADTAYAAGRVAAATSVIIEIVRRKPGQIGFVVQPRRWVVERFFAWISRNRRLWRDVEATIMSATAFLYVAAIMILVRRLARLT